jgi:hypothetical protein
MRKIRNLQNVRNQYPKSQFIENQFDDCILGISREGNIVYCIGKIFQKIKKRMERYFQYEGDNINDVDLNKMSRQNMSILLREVNSSFRGKGRPLILKLRNRK